MKKFSAVHFVVERFGDDVSVVTQLIGFPPTSVACCGFSSSYKDTSWLLELPEPVPEGIGDQLSALIRLLEPHSEGVRRTAVRFPSYVAITFDDRDWIWPHDPSGYRSGQLEIGPELVAAVARIGIGFRVHFFCGLDLSSRKT